MLGGRFGRVLSALCAVAAGFVIIASLLHLAEGGLLHPNLADVHSYQVREGGPEHALAL